MSRGQAFRVKVIVKVTCGQLWSHLVADTAEVTVYDRKGCDHSWQREIWPE